MLVGRGWPKVEDLKAFFWLDHLRIRLFPGKGPDDKSGAQLGTVVMVGPRMCSS